MKYTIKKGKHSSKPKRPILWFGRGVRSYTITLDKSCWYDVKLKDAPKGINKLFGFAFCLHGEKTFGKIPLIKLLVNSALIGWKPALAPGRFHLYSYGDTRGKEYREILQTVVGMDMNFYVDFYISKRYITIKIATPSLEFGEEPKEELVKISKAKILFGYYLKPYFGGKSTALWNMIITITKI